jgi:hypothetical protein
MSRKEKPARSKMPARDERGRAAENLRAAYKVETGPCFTQLLRDIDDAYRPKRLKHEMRNSSK